MTTDRDFLLLALDGLKGRLIALEEQADAIRQAVDALDGPKPKRRKPLAAQPAETEELVPQRRKIAPWTPAMRKAQAARAREYWRRGVFGPKKNQKAKKTVGETPPSKPQRKWTVAQRRKHSETMKKVASVRVATV